MSVWQTVTPESYELGESPFNAMSAERVFHQFAGKPKAEEIEQAQGQLLQDLPLSAQCPTMPCFGGPDGQTLFVTTARKGRSAAELAAMPHSGCVFSMRVDVPGLPTNFFQD